MGIVIIILAVFEIWQLASSTRYAYRLERHQLAAGYPILGHVLHTIIILVLMAALAPKSWRGATLDRVFGISVLISILILPVLHGWMLLKFGRLGEKHRLAALRRLG